MEMLYIGLRAVAMGLVMLVVVGTVVGKALVGGEVGFACFWV